MNIPFNKPFLTGDELSHINNAASLGQLSGDGYYTQQCTLFLENMFEGSKVLLTHSCTAALEMAALLLEIEPGDEIIMPSYTFVSTANAFVMHGAKIVFVDIDKQTLCIDLDLVEQAITPKTRAIVCVHYAGLSCDMDRLSNLKAKYNLSIIEDAAQAIDAFYKKKPLGSFGDMATFSFHETKNIISGEGGCLVINNPVFANRAEIIREKGTNRTQFFRGEVAKYTWVDIGSSFLPGELISAFLFAQLQHKQDILSRRLALWKRYYDNFSAISTSRFKLPAISSLNCHNAHMFYVLCENQEERSDLINFLASKQIRSLFHYIPLHSSPAGLRYSSTYGPMDTTNKISSTLLRLPMFPELSLYQVDQICQEIECYYH